MSNIDDQGHPTPTPDINPTPFVVISIVVGLLYPIWWFASIMNLSTGLRVEYPAAYIASPILFMIAAWMIYFTLHLLATSTLDGRDVLRFGAKVLVAGAIACGITGCISLMIAEPKRPFDPSPPKGIDLDKPSKPVPSDSLG